MTRTREIAVLLFVATIVLVALSCSRGATATAPTAPTAPTATSTTLSDDLEHEDYRDCRAAVPACAPLPAGATLPLYVAPTATATATAPTVSIGTTRDGVIVNIGDNRQVRIAWEETTDCDTVPTAVVCQEL